ncbi:MAG: sugar nucleotide-binding protein [Ignavibacteriales bacterium]|nr:sugar nucleotide-binding protein [Ignavibacteriales bacterium]MCF8306528.1 sugar nucleotide-binding protein [Ignavibacteriales bacterium]MCF8316327.1 sugar nucleotide-binding protein [Ignavibacteriales bacterium]MCF8437715.1 sugar nucleotide-binding protein [Ignavibacteriales bacterium]
MNAVITGLTGTLAPELGKYLGKQGIKVFGWDRNIYPTDDFQSAEKYFRDTMPDMFFHLAAGSPIWAGNIAKLCSELRTPLVFTSSVSVYGGHQKGPFTIGVSPEPGDDYGRYKMQCEEIIMMNDPAAKIARIGWQIGLRAEGNTMTRHLSEEAQKNNGQISASANWFQSCSFLEDTASVLYEIMLTGNSGVYLVNSNNDLNFFELVSLLSDKLKTGWKINRTSNPELNNLMLDDRLAVNELFLGEFRHRA